MSEFPKTRIRFRRGTAAEWSAANPVVLASGEPGFVVDSNTLKIGDGQTAFASLSAIAGGGGGGGGSMSNVVEDTTPQLGGNLDINSKNIIGTGNVALTGSGTFMSVIKSGGTSSQFLKADGSVDSNTYLTSSSALSNIVEDTSPQLGGALDAQSNNITSVGSLGVGGGVTFEKGLTVNNAGAGTSSDFRVRGDSDTHLLFTDAANDKVGISTEFPSHTFSVSGDINATTIVKQGGTSSQFLKADGSSDSNSYQQVLSEGAFVNGDKTKLDAIEASADVTDATNVNAAGAVMNSDSTTAGMSFVVDEDNMSSNSATKVPTQQSVKAYVDSSSDIVGDTSPQLGGALDVNSNNIIGTGNIAISGTGTMAKIGAGLGNGTPAFNLDVTGSGRFVHADGACGLFVQDVSGSGLHFGDCALSANASFAGIKHTHYTGTSDYMMVSDGTDTLLSAKDGGTVYLRGGGNAAEAEIRIHDVGAGGVGIVFNESGADRDIRMESDTSTNMFRLDASANSIGINTATPSHTLAVSGDINAQNVYVSGAPATKSDTTGITGASGVANLVYISSGDYAALSSYSSSTIYFIR